MLTDISLKDMTEEQLEKAYELAFDDLRWSSGEGLAHANAMKRCELIRKEAIKRGYISEDEN